MSDWQAGDLALCINDGPIPGNSKGTPFSVGSVLGVDRLHTNKHALPCLIFNGVDGVWRTSRFRKIRPDAHEDCEPEFVTLLKRSKRRIAA